MPHGFCTVIVAALDVGEVAPEELAAAHEAGLRYVMDTEPGYARRPFGDWFEYYDEQGREIEDDATIERIDRLAIPPAYTDVWICADPRGHLQATGRDARGRKQYRYHPDWRQTRDLDKFSRTVAFGQKLPRLRRRLSRDLALRGLPRDKVLALVVSVLAETLIRVGNHEYARQNNSFGLTTLRDRHVRFPRGAAIFEFRGKSGKDHVVECEDEGLAKLLRRCQQLPGRSCSSTSTRPARRARSAAATSTTTCARPAARTSPPRTSAPGAARWRRSRRSCATRRRPAPASARSRCCRTPR
jgi:DNA topoisomerase-1